MKKLILSAAIILGSFTTFAQTTAAAKSSVSTQTVEEKFTEIKLEEVPSSVILALKTAKPDAVIEKAYINEKKEFKLDIKVGDQKSTVYTDAAGNLTKK
ncbi:hypothetical protein [Flavobacterium aquiphilum]|uniref:hypothetical protein n=1 Tax=Flavobacterium aquiphilum TaxID=3003261 RepID=UPI00247FCFDE|nr:hypothetical protein [Flavobacterium aquiphilum]